MIGTPHLHLLIIQVWTPCTTSMKFMIRVSEVSFFAPPTAFMVAFLLPVKITVQIPPRTGTFLRKIRLEIKEILFVIVADNNMHWPLLLQTANSCLVSALLTCNNVRYVFCGFRFYYVFCVPDIRRRQRSSAIIKIIQFSACNLFVKAFKCPQSI